jgi:hypothetical protein
VRLFGPIGDLIDYGPDRWQFHTGQVERTDDGPSGPASPLPRQALDTTKPVDDQLAQLATYVRELRALFSPIGQQIVHLDRDIADVRQHAETEAAQALTDAKSHADKRLKDIDAEQTRAEVLDLRIAIVGLGITVVGLALALWA